MVPCVDVRARRFFVLILVLFTAATAHAEPLKFATWNLDWLTERPAGDRALPGDVHPRALEDIDRLRQYAQQLNADVVAMQEVDGPNAAARLFPPDRYSIHMTNDNVVQRVGFAVRRGLAYDSNPDVTSFDVGPGERLRSGADITLHLGALRLRLLAVHLKTGCLDASLRRSARRSCAELRAQLPALQAWITARQREDAAFLILGDFNRRMEHGDQLWATLRRTAPLTRATEGRSSPCWGGEEFIDHIIAGGAARAWMQPQTLRVLTYREDASWKDRLSDHCPVSVVLDIPQ